MEFSVLLSDVPMVATIDFDFGVLAVCFLKGFFNGSNFFEKCDPLPEDGFKNVQILR